jgi:hypothetical protein
MRRRYFRADRFLAAFRALVVTDFFFADLRAAVTVRFLAVARPLLPPKMFSQLSEYRLLAPTRVTLIVDKAPVLSICE